MRNPQMERFDIVAGWRADRRAAYRHRLFAHCQHYTVILHPTGENGIEVCSSPTAYRDHHGRPRDRRGSITETAESLRDASLIVQDAFVLVDRQQKGARERLKLDGINLRSALTLRR